MERSVQAYGAPVVFIAPYDNCGMPNPTWSLTVFTHSQNNGFPRLAPASNMLFSCQTPRLHLGFWDSRAHWCLGKTLLPVGPRIWYCMYLVDPGALYKPKLSRIVSDGWGCHSWITFGIALASICSLRNKLRHCLESLSPPVLSFCTQASLPTDTLLTCSPDQAPYLWPASRTGVCKLFVYRVRVNILDIVVHRSIWSLAAAQLCLVMWK